MEEAEEIDSINIVEEFEKWMIKQEYPFSTANLYKGVARDFLSKKIKITQKNIDIYREDKRRNVTSAALKLLFKYLVRHHKYEDNILNIRFERLKKPQKVTKYKVITETELNQILAKLNKRRYYLMTMLMYYCALRISELVILRWSNFRWSLWLENKEEYGQLEILKSKGGKSRVISVHPNIMKFLYQAAIDDKKINENGMPIDTRIFSFTLDEFFTSKEQIQYSDKGDKLRYLFVYRVSSHYRIMLARVSKEAIGKKITPHWLRHSRATELLNKGMSLSIVKEVLGHESISTTEIYAKSTPQSQLVALKQIDNFEEKKNIDLNS